MNVGNATPSTIHHAAHDGPNEALQEKPFQRDVHGPEQVLPLFRVA